MQKPLPKPDDAAVVRSAAIITARTASSRLPEKILADLGGRTVLDRLVERLRTAIRPERLILCTTAEREDDRLVEVARQLGIDVFRGSTSDVLERWRGAAREFDLDLLVACDGDDVFCDPSAVDAVVACHESTHADYIKCVGLPFGTAPTGISRDGLERVCELKTETDTEGQGRFFENEQIVSHATVEASPEVRHEGARMTLDYPEDLEFFRRVTAELDGPGRVFSLREIVALLKAKPEIVEINSGLQAEYWERFNARYRPVNLESK